MKTRIALPAFTAAALLISVPGHSAHAAVTVLDFSGDICGPGGDIACIPGDQIGAGYGDGPGVDVSYQTLVHATGAQFHPYLRYWSGSYGDLTGIVFGGSLAQAFVGEITFAALPGFELTLQGLEAGCYLNRADCRSLPFSVATIGGDIATSGSVAVPAGGHATNDLTLPYSSAGYVLSWGPNAYNGGLDNIAFDVRALSVSAIPEPSTWAMLMLGFVALGAGMRRFPSRTTMKLSD